MGRRISWRAGYDFDLDEIGLRMARVSEIQIVIGTDAYRAGGLSMMLVGVGIARRGWLEKKDALNCLSLSE
jgi:DNA polymerase (family X)